MTKLTRVPLKLFAGSAIESDVSQFGSVIEGSKLHTLNISTIQGLNSWLSGFSKALLSGNRYPSMQEMNGVLKVLCYEQAYQLQEGIAEYDSATTYFMGSIVKKTGTFELYGSLTDTNVGNALSDDTKWQFLCDLRTVDKNVIPQGTCSTASATAAKTVNITGVTLLNGTTVRITFTNANTATSPTLNINSLGAKAIASEDGTICSATNPFYVPAGATVEFVYNGTYWLYRNKIVTNYINGTSWYRQWANGYIEQGGYLTMSGTAQYTINYLKTFSDANYNLQFSPYFGSGVWTFIGAKSTTSFITSCHIGNNPAAEWRACGY